MKKFIISEKGKLKDFTDNTYAQGSFFWNYLIRNKDIKVNGKKVGENIDLFAGDEVAYYLPKEKEEVPSFLMVYEDDNVIVIDKESGVNSEAVFSELSRIYQEVYFIHRLDRNTSGLMIFAKKFNIKNQLLDLFKNKKIEKTYIALCLGKFKKESAVLTAYLKKDDKRAIVKIVDVPVMGAEKIITEYSILNTTNGVNEVLINLHTGKTHQIRAHMAHIGCPVLGDMKYGNEIENKKYNLTRQCLIAKKLQLDAEGELSYLNKKIFISNRNFDLIIANIK